MESADGTAFSHARAYAGGQWTRRIYEFYGTARVGHFHRAHWTCDNAEAVQLQLIAKRDEATKSKIKNMGVARWKSQQFATAYWWTHATAVLDRWTGLVPVPEPLNYTRLKAIRVVFFNWPDLPSCVRGKAASIRGRKAGTPIGAIAGCAPGRKI